MANKRSWIDIDLDIGEKENKSPELPTQKENNGQKKRKTVDYEHDGLLSFETLDNNATNIKDNDQKNSVGMPNRSKSSDMTSFNTENDDSQFLDEEDSDSNSYSDSDYESIISSVADREAPFDEDFYEKDIDIKDKKKDEFKALERKFIELTREVAQKIYNNRVIYKPRNKKKKELELTNLKEKNQNNSEEIKTKEVYYYMFLTGAKYGDFSKEWHQKKTLKQKKKDIARKITLALYDDPYVKVFNKLKKDLFPEEENENSGNISFRCFNSHTGNLAWTIFEEEIEHMKNSYTNFLQREKHRHLCHNNSYYSLTKIFIKALVICVAFTREFSPCIYDNHIEADRMTEIFLRFKRFVTERLLSPTKEIDRFMKASSVQRKGLEMVLKNFQRKVKVRVEEIKSYKF